MEFFTVIILAIVLVGLAFAGLGIKLLFDGTKKILNMHIGSNKEMKIRGITCAQTWDKIEQRKGTNAMRNIQGLSLKND